MPIERRRRPTRHPPRVAIVGERVQVPAGRPPEHGDQVALAERRDLPDRRQPAGVQLAGGDRPDAPQPLDRQRVQELQLLPGRHDNSPSGFATALATLARCLVVATPTVIGNPTSSRTRVRNRSAICSGEPGDAPHAAHVQERLVDRDALHERRRVLEDLEHRLAGLGVGLHARLTTIASGHSRFARRRPWHCGCRTPSPRSSRRAPRRHRRSPACREAAGHPVARPTRRTSRDQREGWSPLVTRTHVRITRGGTELRLATQPARTRPTRGRNGARGASGVDECCVDVRVHALKDAAPHRDIPDGLASRP